MNREMIAFEVPRKRLSRITLVGSINENGARAIAAEDWPQTSMLVHRSDFEQPQAKALVEHLSSEKSYTTRQLCTHYGLPYSTISKLLAAHASKADKFSLRISTAPNALRRWRPTAFWTFFSALGVNVPSGAGKLK